jgi:hypothetical protein
MGKVLFMVGAILLVVALVTGLALLFAFPTLLVWNYLFTSQVTLVLFGAAKLTFWKAFWLNFIAGTLFKGSSVSTSK